MSISNDAVPNDDTKTAFSVLPVHFGDPTEKIPTKAFLEASAGAVTLIERFGKVFTPITMDMNGNIKKLRNKYEQNPGAYNCLQHMILKERDENASEATDALMWLRRALHFLSTFFQMVIQDNENQIFSEDLTPFIKESYSQTLEPYHGWLGTQLFNVLSRFTPTRTTLMYNLGLEKHHKDEHVIKDMRNYTKNMMTCVCFWIDFYSAHDLENITAI